jgi:hypothetical protein
MEATPQPKPTTADAALFSQPTAHSNSQPQNLPGSVLPSQEEAKQPHDAVALPDPIGDEFSATSSSHVDRELDQFEAAEDAALRRFFYDVRNQQRALSQHVDSLEPIVQANSNLPGLGVLLHDLREVAEALLAAGRRYRERIDAVDAAIAEAVAQRRAQRRRLAEAQ